MRALLMLVEIALVLAVVFLVYRGFTSVARGGPRPLPAGGRWLMRHYADGGETVVAVVRVRPGGDVIEEHVVARILDADEDWSRKFLLAKQEAEERAFHLNADGPA